MVRSDLIRSLAEGRPDLPHEHAAAAVTTLFDEIIECLAAGGRVEIRGLGVFTTRPRKARTAHNPRTGETVAVNAKRAVHFRPGERWRGRFKG